MEHKIEHSELTDEEHQTKGCNIQILVSKRYQVTYKQ